MRQRVCLEVTEDCLAFSALKNFSRILQSPAQHIRPEPGTRHVGSEHGFQDLKGSVKDFLLSHLRAYNYYLLQTSVTRCFECCNATVSTGKCFLPLDANHYLHLSLSIFVSPTLLTQVFSGAVLVEITRWCLILILLVQD